ncbi:hypothetical protein FQN50_008493 [Emmonsiellopsis sp. PD_5]|nr:hypothetical protein FQN50_008493 [Emmonsiellopsis sp. PD_5]
MTTTPITTPTSPSFRWRAIVNRDANVNDFVYGVRTTKIYCRPRCPARLARRANVEFYDTPKQAEKAGYRPCKRCKPEDLKAPPDPHIKLAQRACETMMLAAMANRKAQALGHNGGGPNGGIPGGPTGWGGAGQRSRPTLQDLANEAGLTPSHFHRVFKKVVGLTPGKFAREVMEGKKMGAIMKRLAEADSADGTGAGLPKDDEVDFSSPVSVTTSSLGGSPVIDDVRSSPLTDAESYVLPDPAEIRIDWNEFDRMLGASSSSGVGMDVGQNSSSNHNHHSHNSFRIANPTVNELPQQQHHHQHQQPPLPTTTSSAAVSGATHILDPSCSSSSPANILLDYQLPWDSPPNPTTTTTTLNFPTITTTTTACCGKPTNTANGITITSGNANPTNLLSPYDSFLPLDMDMSMGPDFCYTFGTTTTNHTNHSNSNSNDAYLDKLPHLELISAPSSENSSTPGQIDTPPFLDVDGFGSLSASASPLLFDEVDWYGSPSVFQSYV